MSTACAPTLARISGLNGPGSDLGARLVRLAGLAAEEHARRVAAAATQPRVLDQAHRLRLAVAASNQGSER